MAFKGTERRSALDIAAEIEAVGGHLNAYTSREHTAYYAKVLKEDAPLAIDILADILQHSVFDSRELERERTVILQEIGQAIDTPDDIIFDLMQERAFPEQAMGRPVLGRAEIIRGIGRDTVAGYMRRHYAAPGMLLAAAGNIDHDTLVALARRAFAHLPEDRIARSEPAHYVGGDLRQTRDLEQVHVVLGFPGFSYADTDYYAASVVSSALGGGMSSRLFQEIREKRGLVYAIYSFTHAYSDGGLFGVYAGTGEDEVEELIPVLCEEIRRLSDGLDLAELERARAQLKAGLLMSLESTTARCEQQASHMLVFGQPLDLSDMVARIDAVDAAAVTRVARRLRAAPPTLTALGPVGRIEPYRRIAERLGV
jgi:predicted Zn-dependent peptidase